MVVGTLAIGQTLIILTSGIDLSVGAVMGLGSVIMTSMAVDYGMHPVLAVLIGFLVCLAFGLINSGLVTMIRLPPFIVTLGTLNIAFALTRIYTTQTITGLPPLLLFLGNTFRVGNTAITYGSILMVLLYLFTWFVLRSTPAGRYVYAVGDNPEAARLAGISTTKLLIGVYTVAAFTYAIARKRARELLESLGVTLSVDTLTGELSVAEQQLVEIAKALNRQTRILVMDEPSAVLGEKDLEKLFAVVRQLQANGIGIIYISHRLKEIFALADEVTVLKDGRYVDTRRVDAVTMEDLVRLMIGRDLQDVYPRRKGQVGDVLLEVNHINRAGVLNDISFQLRAGEIVGFAGITGSGRTELARVIFGADPYTSGEMRLAGQPYRVHSPADAIRHGVALVTEDRKRQGLLLKLSVTINTTISGLKKLCRLNLIRLRDELSLVQNYIRQLSIKTPGPNFLVVNMSGGNQQKVVLARWLSIGTRVFILDEPTRGIDVGSKAEIYQIMADLADQGVAILMISSELPEVLGMSDRVLVMREGRIAKELSRAEASEEVVMSYAVGGAVA